MKNSNTKKAFRFGFTLQETLIALTILGVVAAITVPMLINKYNEAAKRTKVRKVMATYEKALSQMAVENGNSAISSWADGIENNCANTTVFFKKIAGEGCRFQTSDKVWWDISDIEHPIISINGEITDDMVAHPENYKDSEDLFYLLGTIDENGILRINDLNTVPLSADEKASLEKLYAFVNNEKQDKENENSLAETCPTCENFNNNQYPTCSGSNNIDCFGYNIDTGKYSMHTDNNNTIVIATGCQTTEGVGPNYLTGCSTVEIQSIDPNDTCIVNRTICNTNNGKITDCNDAGSSSWCP